MEISNYDGITNIVLNPSLKYKIVVMPRLKKVLFNPPATIAFWEDDTKTVVKCQNNDIFDPEKGIAMCYMKKFAGKQYGKNLEKALEFDRENNRWLDCLKNLEKEVPEITYIEYVEEEREDGGNNE